MEKMVAQLIIVREIKEVKHLLFGPFNQDRSIKLRCKLWTRICQKAISLGLVAPHKDYRFMRDVYWQNLKRSSLRKAENQKIGIKVATSPVTDLVLEILENTSILHQHQNVRAVPIRTYSKPKPVILAPERKRLEIGVELLNKSLDSNKIPSRVPPINKITSTDVTVEVKEEPVDIFYSDTNAEDVEHDVKSNTETNDTNEPDTSNSAWVVQENNGCERDTDKPAELSSEDSVDEIKIVPQNIKTTENMMKRKAELELEFLELQNYKAKLKCLELETKLGLKPSKFTKDIAKSKHKLIFENDDDDLSDRSD